MELKNKTINDTSNAIFEQYKLYVEMADKISERRNNVNTFFVALHTVLLGIVGVNGFSVQKYWYIIVILGVMMSYVWYYLLQSYKLLNAGKYEVIHEMEQFLPFNMYSYEWEKLRYGEDRAKYWPISHLEKKIPVVFGIVYIIFGVYVFIGR